MANRDEQIRGLLKEEIAFTKDCPDDCKHIDAHAHKAGLEQLLALLKEQPCKPEKKGGVKKISLNWLKRK